MTPNDLPCRLCAHQERWDRPTCHECRDSNREFPNFAPNDYKAWVELIHLNIPVTESDAEKMFAISQRLSELEGLAEQLSRQTKWIKVQLDDFLLRKKKPHARY